MTVPQILEMAEAAREEEDLDFKKALTVSRAANMKVEDFKRLMRDGLSGQQDDGGFEVVDFGEDE